MATTKASDLRKQVIDIKTGRHLGELIDVELDDQSGKIVSIVVPGEAKFFGLVGTGPDVVIPWSNIKKIGPDCILVEVDRDSFRESQRDSFRESQRDRDFGND